MALDRSLAGIPDAFVRKVDAVPARLADGVRAGLCVEAGKHTLLLVMPRVGRFLVHEGRFIDVQASAGAEPELVDVIVGSTCRAALIHQRGELALEATTVAAPDGRCLALAGFSGLGKSTVAAALIQRGWRLVADGITRVTSDASGTFAWPGSGVLKLWRSACEALGITAEGLPRVRRQLEKFYVPVQAVEAPVALTTIVRFGPDETIVKTTVDADERLPLLADSTYRVGQIGPMGMEEECTRTATRVAQTVPMFKLGGARKHSLSEYTDAVAGSIA